MPASCTSPGVALPLDIIGLIVAESWSQAAAIQERRDLYNTLLAVHPLVHELLVSYAVRHPYFTFMASHEDIDFYREIADRAASFARPGVESESSVTANMRAQPHHVHVHLNITFLAQFVSSADVVRQRWVKYSSVFQTVVPDLASLTLFCAVPIQRREFWLSLRFLNAFPRLTHVHLDLEHFADYGPISGHTSRQYLDPIPVHSGVRSLRLKQYPQCRRHPSSHCITGECLGISILHAFPNVRHLHLDEPVFLKFLDPPHSLHTVTLEAPLLQLIPGRAPFNTITGYNVTAALRRGFLQWPRPRGGRNASPPTIVVRTGLVEPQGYEQARAACAEYGIALRREIAYMQ